MSISVRRSRRYGVFYMAGHCSVAQDAAGCGAAVSCVGITVAAGGVYRGVGDGAVGAVCVSHGDDVAAVADHRERSPGVLRAATAARWVDYADGRPFDSGLRCFGQPVAQAADVEWVGVLQLTGERPVGKALKGYGPGEAQDGERAD